MKKYTDILLVSRFLVEHGIAPSIQLFALSHDAWSDLVSAADEWEETQKKKTSENPDMPEEEATTWEAWKEQERMRQEAELEQERLLYHSAGYRPKDKT